MRLYGLTYQNSQQFASFSLFFAYFIGRLKDKFIMVFGYQGFLKSAILFGEFFTILFFLTKVQINNLLS